MLDFDLAALSNVETKHLNQAVRRNLNRFPEDFYFQLSPEAHNNLKSQFVTSSWGGKRKLPIAFTEHASR
ncbi:MAG: ORF6N domain-containing protein [Bacteroidia bacterium]|nr:ORF6N domain-containing protein [Bacteroidia bacterium]